MRVLYDPETLKTINALGPAVEGLGQAAATVGNARREAAFLEQEQEQERINRQRELRDLEKQQSRTLARTLAVMAAQGGGAGDPSTAALISSQAGEFGVRGERIRIDSETREATLGQKRENVLAAGRNKAFEQAFGGARKSASKLKTIFKTGKKPKKGS